jgi:hypothetical protein
MMKGTGKIKKKIIGIKEMSNDKAQSSNETKAIPISKFVIF